LRPFNPLSPGKGASKVVLLREGGTTLLGGKKCEKAYNGRKVVARYLEHSMPDPTQRFSNRVENYIRYRPGYPEGVIDILRREAGLTPGTVIADIGSGTGISSELFLKLGNAVHGVEPNAEMRRAAERLLARHPNFHSVDATAEETTLPDASVDLIVAGQAFHWFDQSRARTEFRRILRPGGWVALLWNTRRTNSTPFLRDYEALLKQFGTDYAKVRHDNLDAEQLAAFFEPGPYRRFAVDNFQHFDWEGLRGRLLSSSYVPGEGDVGYQPMLTGLQALFNRYQQNGVVEVEYDTEIHLGRWERCRHSSGR
jgi:SAM-dependent methyltransferase